MARTINEIYESIRAEALRLATDANNTAAQTMLASTSRVAIWKMIFFACASAVWVLEKLFDAFRVELDDRLAQKKPHSARWYAEKAKAFQFGFNLQPESDTYDNTGYTDDQVEDSKVIKHAAVLEQERGIRIKVAVESGGDLAKAGPDVMTAFDAYIEQIKDAGIKIIKTTGDPDELKAKLRIYYNAQVLRSDGGRIDGTDPEPVQNALRAYLKDLPFNGLFVPQLAVDRLQAVDGVVIVKDDVWEARYGALDFAAIDVEYTPDAGYLRLEDGGLDIQFIPHAAV